jgi:hypothetical protein
MGCVTAAVRMTRSWRLPALGTLVPHWAAGPAFPAVPPAPVVIAEAMLRVLRWPSPERGAVVVLEDMHWADRETLTMLEYLADHVAAFPVAVVLTVRSDEPGTFGLGSRLTRGAPHLHLASLADSQVAAMAAACLGVDAASAAAIAGLRRLGPLTTCRSRPPATVLTRRVSPCATVAYSPGYCVVTVRMCGDGPRPAG